MTRPRVALIAACVLLVAADNPEGRRSGRFASRPTGLVGLSRATVDLEGGTLTFARDGDTFANFAARDFGTRRRFGLIKVTRPTRGITVRDVVAEGGYRFLDVTGEGMLTDSSVERVRASGLVRSFARVGGNSHGIVFRDIVARFRSAPAEPPELPGGIQVDDQAHDILVERVAVSGARMRIVPGRYTNGDGFSTERGNTRIVFREATAEDNSDGGFDLKSTETRLERTASRRNGRNYRLWGSGEATTITSEEPHHAHLWVGARADWRIGKLVVRSTTSVPVIRLAGPARLRIDDYDIQVPPGTPIVVDESGGAASVDWGPRGAPAPR